MALAGITKHPDKVWMKQMARNAVDSDSGYLRNQRYILHDRDTKFRATFRSILESVGTKCLTLPPRRPNVNAYSEGWVRSAKEECLRKLIVFGEGSLRRAAAEYVSHFHGERNRQGKGNVLLFPIPNWIKGTSHVIQRNQRLGGLLSYYSRANADSGACE